MPPSHATGTVGGGTLSFRTTRVGATITIVVVAVLLVIIVALLIVVASKTKVLCWAEKFATFQGASFSNPTFEHGGAGGNGSGGHVDDGELYVAPQSTRPPVCGQVGGAAAIVRPPRCRTDGAPLSC